MTADIVQLCDWLASEDCTHVAMESTGVYWKPIYNLLEAIALVLLVVNARDIKAVPGRKTDVRDAEWIADLLRHRLLRGSFIPDRAHRELRELVRYRRDLIGERTREVNRLQEVLEGANVKLGDVASSVVGKSGTAILEAMIGGETDPAALAELARGRLRSKRAALGKAFHGLVGPHQKMLLALQLEHIRALDQMLERLTQSGSPRKSASKCARSRQRSMPWMRFLGLAGGSPRTCWPR